MRRARHQTHYAYVHTILLGRHGNVLLERGAHFVEDGGVDRGEVARELVAHDRDVELVVYARAEGVAELQDLYAYACETYASEIRSAPNELVCGMSGRKEGDGRGGEGI